jgi:hypothetical protein
VTAKFCRIHYHIAFVTVMVLFVSYIFEKFYGMQIVCDIFCRNYIS